MICEARKIQEWVQECTIMRKGINPSKSDNSVEPVILSATLNTQEGRRKLEGLAKIVEKRITSVISSEKEATSDPVRVLTITLNVDDRPFASKIERGTHKYSGTIATDGVRLRVLVRPLLAKEKKDRPQGPAGHQQNIDS